MYGAPSSSHGMSCKRARVVIAPPTPCHILFASYCAKHGRISANARVTYFVHTTYRQSNTRTDRGVNASVTGKRKIDGTASTQRPLSSTEKRQTTSDNQCNSGQRTNDGQPDQASGDRRRWHGGKNLSTLRFHQQGRFQR